MVSLKSFILKRTWLRFSLATFMLAVAVIAYCCKWTLDRVTLCAGQYDVVASLSGNEAEFRRFFSPEAGRMGEGSIYNNFGFAEPRGWEKSLAQWLGVDYPIDVVVMGIYGPRVDFSKDLEVAKRFPKLNKLIIIREEITADTVNVFKKMRALKRLSLSDTHLSEATVIALKGMKRLENLSFSDTNITKEMAAAFKKALPNTQIIVYKKVSDQETSVVVDLP